MMIMRNTESKYVIVVWSHSDKYFTCYALQIQKVLDFYDTIKAAPPRRLMAIADNEVGEQPAGQSNTTVIGSRRIAVMSRKQHEEGRRGDRKGGGRRWVKMETSPELAGKHEVKQRRAEMGARREKEGTNTWEVKKWAEEQRKIKDSGGQASISAVTGVRAWPQSGVASNKMCPAHQKYTNNFPVCRLLLRMLYFCPTSG